MLWCLCLKLIKIGWQRMFILRKIEKHIILDEALLTHQLTISVHLKQNALSDWSYECTPSRLNVFRRRTVLHAYSSMSLIVTTPSCLQLSTLLGSSGTSIMIIIVVQCIWWPYTLLYSETSVTVLFLLSILIIKGLNNILELEIVSCDGSNMSFKIWVALQHELSSSIF